MQISFKVVKNTALPRFETMPAHLEAQLQKTFSVIGERVVDTAKGIVPVRTGALRASITYQVKPNNVMVGAGMRYAGYVEFGTRKMRARPYLRPAIQSNLKFIDSELRSAVVAALLR